MSTTYHLRNNDGTEVFTGTISPAPGGGSQPLVVTFTAAEVAARFDVPTTSAAIELADIGANDVVLGMYELANDLDTGSPGSSQLVAYTPGASSSDVFNNGNAVAQVLTVSVQTYVWTLGFGGNPVTFAQLVSGDSAYAVITCSAAPTTGSVTLRILLAA